MKAIHNYDDGLRDRVKIQRALGEIVKNGLSLLETKTMN